MNNKRWDETWHRLVNWTNGQGPSERLAAQILLSEGFRDLDPSHPLGGPDGRRDAIATRDGKTWIMAVYFPRGQQTLRNIRAKLQADYMGVGANGAYGLAFVCNQELTLAQRDELAANVSGPLELYHLERITTVLDQPRMGTVRRQYKLEDNSSYRLEALQTGGDTYAYVMFYHFDLDLNIARNFVVIRNGEYPLYDLRIRIMDMVRGVGVLEGSLGELNSAADYKLVEWPLPPSVYYRIFFFARNGNWRQDLQLRKSPEAGCWLAATIVYGHQQAPEYQHLDNEFGELFGPPAWRD
jgi:hypothetical protein